MNVISLVHRILGETLLLVALLGVILAVIGLVRKQKMERAEKLFGTSYAGLLDLQALLGLIQFVYLLLNGATGLISSIFILHPILMVLAVVVVHASRTRRDSPIPTRHRAQLLAYGLSLLFIFAGRMIIA
jgi:heme A synthase